MDFRTVIKTIALRWKIVAIAAVACLLGAAAITMLQARTYESSATILVSVPGAVTVSDAYEATQAAQQRLSSYAEIAGGRTVAQRAIDQLKAPITAEQLVADTKVSYAPESTLFRLTVTATDAQRAAALASAMADQFADLVPEVDPAVPLGAEATPSLESGTDGQQTTATAKATVVEEPVVPQDAVSPVPARNLVLGLLTGLLLGVAVALTWDAFDRTVRGRDKLVASSGLPVLAELPAPGDDDGVLNEAIRGLRTRLTGPSTAQDRSFLVTAAAPGEGATTTALNLALSFASAGERVLLVEGGQEALADLLGVKSDLALSDLLSDGKHTSDAAASTSHTGLYALTSETEGVRSEFSTPALIAALQRLCADYDRVVIDGPPALVAADAASFAAAVDATVLVVRSGATTVDDVEGALENLRAAGGKVVGTVLTGASVNKRTKAAMIAYREKVSDTGVSADHTVRA